MGKSKGGLKPIGMSGRTLGDMQRKSSGPAPKAQPKKGKK